MLTITPEILTTLKEFNRNVEWLKRKEMKEKKGVWVSVTEVVKMTGWDKEGLRRARERGLVKFKKEDGSFKYDLTSIHEIFIKK